MLPFAGIQNQMLESKVDFYNFSSVGKDQENNLVKEVSYEGSVIPEVQFMDSDYAVAFRDAGASVFYGKHVPEEKKEIAVEKEIVSTFYDESYFGIVTENGQEENTHKYKVEVYRENGSRCFQAYFDMEYTQIKICGEEIFFYNGTELMIYTTSGKLKYLAEYEKQITDVIPLTGIVLLIFLLFMIRGYRRGLIKSLASVISLAASVVLVSFVTPYVSQFLQEQTPVYTYVMEKCQESFTVSLDEKTEKLAETEEKTEEEEISLKSIQSDNDRSVAEKITGESDRQMQKKAIDELPIPDMLKKLLINNNTEKTYQKLAVNSFNDYVPKFMANLIMNIIAFVLTWVIVASFIWLAVMTLDVIANLPVIHGINQVLGLLLGFMQALAIVWITFLVITIFSSTAIGKLLMEMIEKSVILDKLYDLNVFLNFLQKTIKI